MLLFLYVNEIIFSNRNKKKYFYFNTEKRTLLLQGIVFVQLDFHSTFTSQLDFFLLFCWQHRL